MNIPDLQFSTFYKSWFFFQFVKKRRKKHFLLHRIHCIVSYFVNMSFNILYVYMLLIFILRILVFLLLSIRFQIVMPPTPNSYFTSSNKVCVMFCEFNINFTYSKNPEPFILNMDKFILLSTIKKTYFHYVF